MLPDQRSIAWSLRKVDSMLQAKQNDLTWPSTFLALLIHGRSMKTVISLVAFCVACHATADVQKIQYNYDDSDAEYSLVSFAESDSVIQAIVQREGAYFTSYTKVELDCANRNVRHTGMYNSLEGLEKAQFDQMQGRIVEGSIADEVGKVLCKGTTLTASQADNPPAKEQTDDRT